MRNQVGSKQIGILSFEVAGAMSKTVQLHRSLSPSEISILRNDVFKSHAVRHLVSGDDARLLSLAAAEKLEQLRRVAAVVSRLGKRCAEPAMVGFEHVFSDLLSGKISPSEPRAFSPKEMDSAVKKMERFVSSTALLFSELELHSRRKKHLREISLWSQTPEKIFSLMARAISSLFTRIRLLYSSPAKLAAGSTAAGLAAPSTVGGSALALHYANIIIIVEKFLRFPHLVGEEARDDLYQMLPTSLKTKLRSQLRSYAKDLAIYDAPVAFDWKTKLEKIFTWLSPMAHHMVTWQTERNFDQSRLISKANVLLLQTIYFADRVKTEAVICELLVGLNYICRYEQQHTALLRCAGSFDFDQCVDWRL